MEEEEEENPMAHFLTQLLQQKKRKLPHAPLMTKESVVWSPCWEAANSMTKESVVWSPFWDLWEQTLVWLLVHKKALMGLPRHQRQNPHPHGHQDNPSSHLGLQLLANLQLPSQLPSI